jgi:sterol desaturase/sphingolipid hydroxylase (fatty acid hydroxylase superfamily)
VLEHFSVFAILIVVLLLALTERLMPNQELPPTHWWWPRVGALQLMVYLVVTVGVSSWQEGLMSIRLFNGEKYLSTFWGGVVSYLVGTFIFYWWHFARHRSSFLWRAFHQIHHSPSRIQSVTAFYVHPLEAVASSLINAVLVFVIMGLGKDALIWNASFTAALGVFYHSNIRTPQWLGYFVQRPEMHRQHHEIHVHGYNYGDLPIWDMLFKTYRNPSSFSGVYGFGENRELKLGSMLLGEDISNPEMSPLRDVQSLDI